MKNKLVDALNRETSQITLFPDPVMKSVLFMMAYFFFRSTVFATGNVDDLMCSLCNSSSCISHMFLNSLLGESIKFMFKNKCCLNKEKKKSKQMIDLSSFRLAVLIRGI